MIRVGELAGDAGHVVVVQEGQQMGPLVQGPLLRPELAVQGVGDLEQVQGVEAGPQALIALVVGHAVAQLRAHPTVIVPVEGLAYQDKVEL